MPVYQVRLDWLPLPCIALIWPSQLSCLGSSVGRASICLVSSMLWVQIPPEQLFFHWKKRYSGLLYCLAVMKSNSSHVYCNHSTYIKVDSVFKTSISKGGGKTYSRWGGRVPPAPKRNPVNSRTIKLSTNYLTQK